MADNLQGKPTFSCNLDEFKKLVKQFLDAVEVEEDLDALDQAKKCLGLHYLGLQGPDVDTLIGASYFKFAMKKYLDKELELEFGMANPLEGMSHAL